MLFLFLIENFKVVKGAFRLLNKTFIGFLQMLLVYSCRVFASRLRCDLSGNGPGFALLKLVNQKDAFAGHVCISKLSFQFFIRLYLSLIMLFMIHLSLGMVTKCSLLAAVLRPRLLRELDKLILSEAQYLVECINSWHFATLEHSPRLPMKLRQPDVLTSHWVLHYLAHLLLIKFPVAFLQFYLHGYVDTFGR